MNSTLPYSLTHDTRSMSSSSTIMNGISLLVYPSINISNFINAYRSLLQVVSMIILFLLSYPPSILTLSSFMANILNTGKILNHMSYNFVKRIILDVHICLHDYLTFRIHSFSPARHATIFQSFPRTCLHISPKSPKCNFLLEFAKYVGESTSPSIQKSSSSTILSQF
uniref:Uncharacterized protein n=1 Tax=Opuntia streptacantha TaxID=393608 RepID=A0A7C9D9V8_OPUST